MSIPALVCFGVWLAYGLLLWRGSARIRDWASRKSRTLRAAGGTGLLFLGAAVLVGGLMALEPLGMSVRGTLKPVGWVVAGVLGLAFVHAQVVAAALMASLIRENVQLERLAEASDRTKVIQEP